MIKDKKSNPNQKPCHNFTYMFKKEWFRKRRFNLSENILNLYLLVANTGDRNLALKIVHKSQAVKLVEEKHRKVIRENGICEVFFKKAKLPEFLNCS